jgi:prevent-host-death family protein
VERVSENKERVLISRDGKPVAAVVPVEDLELIERLEDEIDLREAEKALEDVRVNGTIPLEEVKAELGFSDRRSGA